MSKRKADQQAERRLFHVGRLVGAAEDEFDTRDILARDAREAVRAYCESLPPGYWEHDPALHVRTRTYSSGARGLQQETTRRWSVDAGHPPAWIIERADDE
jgi:hypothetical protein